MLIARGFFISHNVMGKLKIINNTKCKTVNNNLCFNVLQTENNFLKTFSKNENLGYEERG